MLNTLFAWALVCAHFVAAHWGAIAVVSVLVLSALNKLLPGHPRFSGVVRQLVSLLAASPMAGARSAVFLLVASKLGDGTAAAIFHWLSTWLDIPILSISVTAPGGQPMLGKLRTPLLAFAAVIFLVVPAHAQAAAAAPTGGTLADVAPSDPPPATPTRFGGCNKVGTFCYGPAANLSLVLFNLKTADFTLGVVPGVGYGVTFFANQPYKIGVGLFGNFKGKSENSPSSGLVSGVVSFAEYAHLGAAYEVIGGKGTPYMLASIGANL